MKYYLFLHNLGYVTAMTKMQESICQLMFERAMVLIIKFRANWDLIQQEIINTSNKKEIRVEVNYLSIQDWRPSVFGSTQNFPGTANALDEIISYLF
jgi:hypothetical protein